MVLSGGEKRGQPMVVCPVAKILPLVVQVQPPIHGFSPLWGLELSHQK